MTKLHLVVDGMLSGTGVRHASERGYVDPAKIGISAGLQRRISEWLARYEDAHYRGFKDRSDNDMLDREGISIARMIKSELPNMDVDYYSAADLRRIPLS